MNAEKYGEKYNEFSQWISGAFASDNTRAFGAQIEREPASIPAMNVVFDSVSPPVGPFRVPAVSSLSQGIAPALTKVASTDDSTTPAHTMLVSLESCHAARMIILFSTGLGLKKCTVPMGMPTTSEFAVGQTLELAEYEQLMEVCRQAVERPRDQRGLSAPKEQGFRIRLWLGAAVLILIERVGRGLMAEVRYDNRFKALFTTPVHAEYR